MRDLKLTSFRSVTMKELIEEVKLEKSYFTDREIFDYIMSDDYLLDECLKMVNELYPDVKTEFNIINC